jgi:hypothetical protein
MRAVIFLSRMTPRSLAVKVLWSMPKKVSDRPLALFSHHHYEGVSNYPIIEANKHITSHTIVIDDIRSINDENYQYLSQYASHLIILVTWYDIDYIDELRAYFDLPIHRLATILDHIPIAYGNILSDQATLVPAPATVGNMKQWGPYLANMSSLISHYQTKSYRQIVLTDELEVTRTVLSYLAIRTTSDPNQYNKNNSFDILVVDRLDFPVEAIDVIHIATNSLAKVDQCVSIIYDPSNYLEGNKSGLLLLNFYPTKGSNARLSSEPYQKRDIEYKKYLKIAPPLNLM